MRCYILAGGDSRRMGMPKESLRFGGQTLLERVATAAATAFEETVLVVRSSSRAPVSPPIGRILADRPHGETAPIFGLQRALEDAAEKGEARAWILAVDYPLVSAELLAYLRSQFDSSDAEMFVPVVSGQPQMLCAGYAVAVLPAVRSRIDADEFKIRGLAQSFRTQFLPEHVISSRFDPICLRSVNTPEEFEELRKLHEEAHASR